MTERYDSSVGLAVRVYIEDADAGGIVYHAKPDTLVTNPLRTGTLHIVQVRRVVYDTAGIVYHAKYLHYMERARTEWVRHKGVGLRAGLADNISYVVQRLSIHYGAPARLDDELRVTAEPVAFGRVWMDFRQQVVRRSDDKVLASADVRVACIALDSGRPRRLPVNMLELLESSLKTNSQVE